MTMCAREERRTLVRLRFTVPVGYGFGSSMRVEWLKRYVMRHQMFLAVIVMYGNVIEFR